MIGGVIFFGEQLTFGKIVGILFFFGAFALMDKNTWEFVASRFRKNAVVNSH
jgi:hypothetical protein